ncbi:DUF6515 family protein [Mucilaginibacter sp. UYCu711]|uniref:DUF6515 family protein n=1 Tax=Mucilaginibacter sp. UYCu711 TaxID=3156339 RepID=UPI003D1F0C98
MRKTYKNLTGFALSAILCLGVALSASAQRGGEHSDTKTTPPPAAPAPQVQRSSPPPQQQSAPRQQPPQQQATQQQAPQRQQPQVQRGGSQQGQSQQQPNSFDRGRANNAVGTTQSLEPRGGEHRTQPVFTPANPNNGGRRYPGITQRGNSNSYNPRGGAYNQGRSSGFDYRRGNSYRSYPGLQFGHNYITARSRGFYYRNRGYYQTYYTPQLGFNLSVLPYGYYPFYFGADQYFYNEGLYYRQMENNEYTVVEPPIGAAIDKLPAKAQAISINGMQYYELNGVYYQPITKDDGSLAYQIAGKDGELNTVDNGSPADDLPQVGDLVDNLPEGCKIIKLNGQRYYVSQEGYYFQDAVDTNGDKVYKIVGTPTDAPND